MIEKMASELRFVGSKIPMPTIELNLESLSNCLLHGYADLVHNALCPLAANDHSLNATVWVYRGASFSFQKAGYSAFFAVAGGKQVLQTLSAAFARIPGLLFRDSDPIRQSDAASEFHIQDGHVWHEEDPHLWQTREADATNTKLGDIIVCTGPHDSLSNMGGEVDEVVAEWGEHMRGENELVSADVQSGENLPVEPRSVQKGRLNRARADASLGTITDTIEALFGLPEGSVALRGPDRKVLRRDATVGTLRKRWE